MDNTMTNARPAGPVNLTSPSSPNIHSDSSPLPTRKIDIEKDVQGDLSSLSAQVEPIPRPPLLFKLTAYRLLTLAIIVRFGAAIPEAFKFLEGGETTATWLDWVLGVLLGIALCWLRLYERVHPPIAVWFFHTDFAPDIFYLLFGIVVITTYLELYILCVFHILTMSLKVLPEPNDFEGLMFILVCLAYVPSTAILVIPSLLAAMALPFLACAAIPCVVLTLGGRRFRRQATNFFVTEYWNRCQARPVLYASVTYLSVVVIIYVVNGLELVDDWFKEVDLRAFF